MNVYSARPHIVGLALYTAQSWTTMIAYSASRLVVQYLQKTTSSSAVAERPRDALCPSVVSLNKIIPCGESFIIVT